MALASITAYLGLQSGVRRVIVCLQFTTSGRSTFSLSVSFLFSLCLFHLFDCTVRPEVSFLEIREGKEKERTRARTGSDL